MEFLLCLSHAASLELDKCSKPCDSGELYFAMCARVIALNSP